MHIESLKITSLIMKYYHLLQMKQKKTLYQKSFGIKMRLCSVITMEIVSLFGQMI